MKIRDVRTANRPLSDAEPHVWISGLKADL